MKKSYSIDELKCNIKERTLKRLEESGKGQFCIWGLADGDRNIITFSRLKIGDDVVFYRNEGGDRKLFCRAKIAATEENKQYGLKLWKADNRGRVFTLLFYLSDCCLIESQIDPVEMNYSKDCRFQSSILFDLGSSNYYYLKRKMEVDGKRIC